jgi:hypothetical protein
MRKTGLVVAAAVAVLALPTGASAANTRDAVTGGGQAFFGTNGESGPGAGDTVAFTAKRAKGAADGSSEAVGQIQVNRRTTGEVKFHGTFDCLVANGEPGSGAGYAYASGQSRDGTPFELYVSDGGKGAMERNDMIMLYVGDETEDNGSDGPCGFEDFDPETDSISLSRGNVQVRNRNTSEDEDAGSNSESEASPLSFLGL